MSIQKSFNKTTAAFNNVTYAALLNVTRSQTGKTVDVGGCDDDDVENVMGRIDHAMSLEVIGAALPAVPHKDDLVIAWAGVVTADTVSNVLLIGAEETGAIDDKISMKLTFVKGTT